MKELTQEEMLEVNGGRDLFDVMGRVKDLWEAAGHMANAEIKAYHKVKDYYSHENEHKQKPDKHPHRDHERSHRREHENSPNN